MRKVIRVICNPDASGRAKNVVSTLNSQIILLFIENHAHYPLTIDTFGRIWENTLTTSFT